ncbi:hypothetical protein KCP75_06565 [Salmonella enterica subsp. enterica]|nr:hypothetical protein KCP75_06565 [Salmonella enterica subsp. enterica]
MTPVAGRATVAVFAAPVHGPLRPRRWRWVMMLLLPSPPVPTISWKTDGRARERAAIPATVATPAISWDARREFSCSPARRRAVQAYLRRRTSPKGN